MERFDSELEPQGLLYHFLTVCVLWCDMIVNGEQKLPMKSGLISTHSSIHAYTYPFSHLSIVHAFSCAHIS